MSVPALALTFTVSKTADTNDGTCDADCSFREAIKAANDKGTIANTINFNIPGGSDSGCAGLNGVCTIKPTSALPSLSDNDLTINGYTQGGATANTNNWPNPLNTALRIVIDGTSAGGGSDGLTINNVPNNIIKGLTVMQFGSEGIVITGASATGNKIQGCFIGTSYDGTVDRGNTSHGIFVTASASSAVIGTDGNGVGDANERNLISGNNAAGVRLDSGTNTVAGNFIGTNFSGEIDLGNTGQGININGGSDHMLGTNGNGTYDFGEGNLISGNDANGINIGAFNSVIIAGNFIGLNAGGTVAIKNSLAGINAAGNNHRIGTNANGVSDIDERNVIAGHSVSPNQGITGSGTGVVVKGNYIGTDKTGSLDVGNDRGIQFSNTGWIIGTDGDGVGDVVEGNLISGNNSNGILAAPGGNGAVIAGNKIGTNSGGTTALGNTDGVSMTGGNTNRIGTNADGTSDALERNIISGNTAAGITVEDGSTGALIFGNYIGVDASGTTALGNVVGIQLGQWDGLTAGDQNTVGTNGDGVNDATERNVISGNTQYGVDFRNSDNNIVAGNYIGVGSDGISDLGNLSHGVFWSYSGGTGNRLGGDVAAEANTIAFNGDAANEYGIYVQFAASDNNIFQRNKMYSNQDIGIKLNGDGANNDQAAPSLTGRTVNGVNLDITGTSTNNAVVQLFDASGDNEGETYISQVTANGSGNWTIAISSPYNASGNVLVATATDGVNGTSQFSSSYTINNAIPENPSALGPTVLVNGSSTSDATPTFTFSLSDNDAGDTVKYQIQVDNNADFSSREVDYTSALAAQGAKSFTVGQAAGSGTYAVGAAGDVLQKGNWYWRVQAIDYFGAISSGWTTANGGAVAFVESAYTVNTTGDTAGTCDNTCTLREAIAAANGAASNTVQFEIPTSDANYSGGVWKISPTSALPSITGATMTIDGYTQTGAIANTNVNGDVLNGFNGLNTVLKIVLDGTNAGAAVDGLKVNNVANTVIKGLNIMQFAADGVEVTGASATNTKIQGCFIGTDNTGALDKGNTLTGVNVVFSAVAIIGTDGDGVSDPAERNLIAGNNDSGVWLAGAVGSKVMGNIIGLAADGASDLGNTDRGVRVNTGSQTIGTNGDGTADSAEGNVISGNDTNGVYIAGVDNVSIRGNFIGLSADGSAARANSSHGILSDGGTTDNGIFGTDGDGVSDTLERNVVSGNLNVGILTGGNNNVISGNITGLDRSGLVAIANAVFGIQIWGGDSNRIGTNGDGTSDAAERNIVSGNTSDGINLRDADTSTVAGNYVGVAGDGTTDRGNGRHGIYWATTASIGIIIGGDVAAEANTIAFNGDTAGEYGAFVTLAGSDNNVFSRNSFFSNQDIGIKLNGDGANNNQAVPVVSSDACSGLNLVVSGTAAATEVVQLFDASSDAEGETYIDQATANGSGNWSITVTDGNFKAQNNTLVATATNGVNGTSQFTTAYTVVSNCTRKRIWIIDDY